MPNSWMLKENIKTMSLCKLYKMRTYLVLSCCLCFMVQLSSQIILPQIGDTLFSYSSNLDQLTEATELDFYDLDFHCMDRRVVQQPDAPRIDYGIKNQNGLGEVYAVKDGVLYIKGFHMTDPYFGNSVKFMQLIGGIPLLDLEQMKDYRHKGTQSIYLEYSIDELPEQMKLWAALLEYKKMRLKVAIDYQTAYKGTVPLALFDKENYHQLYTSYTFTVAEVMMKKDDWTVVPVNEIMGKDQYLQDIKVAYDSYYNGVTLYPSIRSYSHPTIKQEYNLPKQFYNLPICSAAAAQVYVYPNPTLGDLNVRILDLEPGTYDFAVYNIVGYKVWETELQYGEQELFRLRLPRLEKGIYLYSIKNKAGRYIQSRRLTVLEY